MILPELLARIGRLGVKLSVMDDGKLEVDAPAGVLEPELRSALAVHKSAIVAALTKPAVAVPPPWPPRPDELVAYEVAHGVVERVKPPLGMTDAEAVVAIDRAFSDPATAGWTRPPDDRQPFDAGARTPWARSHPPRDEQPAFELEAFLKGCFERHGLVYPTPFESRPRPLRNCEAEAARGDELRARGLALPLG
jgi:hypothetical protein